VTLRADDVFQEKYRIISRLGRGGMGIVYRAVEISIDRPVAIKCIRDLKLVEEDAELALARLVREANMLSRVRHSGVVQLYDFGLDDDDVPYMVTEFIPGRNLGFPAEGANELPSARRWAAWRPLLAAVEGTLEILEEVHRVEVVHRDIKHSNLMIQDTHGEGTLVRLLDFGLARLLRRKDPADAKWMSRLNRRAIKGTPDYMAPEQFDVGQTESPRLDLYAVGVLLHRGLSGGFPYPRFTQKTPMGDYIKLRRGPPVFALDPRVPRPLADVVRTATALQPADRFANARSMKTALQGAIEESAPDPGHSIVVPGRRRSPPPNDEAPRPGRRPPRRPPDLGSSPDPAAGCPALGECLVVIPSAGSAALADEFAAALDAVIRPALGKLAIPGLDPLLRVTTLDSNELVNPQTAVQALQRLEYSRVVLWEKSHLDPPASRLLSLEVALGNVTAIQLVGHDCPSELRHLPSVRYDPRVEGQVRERSQATIREAVMAVLGQRWRLPALTRQWQHTHGDAQMKELGVETLTQWAGGDRPKALAAADQLVSLAPREPLFLLRRAYLRSRLSGGGRAWRGIARDLRQVTAQVPELGAAWRELGVAWNRINRRQRAMRCLREAIRLDPRDYDALASYGGVLKRQATLLENATQRAYEEAMATYRDARDISDGHPYPTLNWLRLDFRQRGDLEAERGTRNELERLVDERAAQVAAEIDVPWSYFDQVEALLYLERPYDAERTLGECLALGTSGLPTEALETFRDTLDSLRAWFPDREALARLRERVAVEVAQR
jgi:eukaryotic-like serine/threonine-protein kinase